MRKFFPDFLMFLVLATPAFAEINVVATLPWIGSMAKEIGRDKVNITVLVKPNQDPHYVEAKHDTRRKQGRRHHA